MRLLMITGDRALAEGKHGAFYNTIEELHKHWDRVDIITPRITNYELRITNLFGNVFIHSSPWSLIHQSRFILKKGLEIFKENRFDVMTVHEFPPFYNGIGARLLWTRIKVPYLLEIFHIPGYPKPAGLKEKIYKNLMRFFIRYDAAKAKAVRVMNRHQVPDFLIKSGVPKEKINYIPAVYADLETFKPVSLAKEWELIFIGRLESNKGVDLFLEAVRKLNCSAIVVGDGSLRKDIKLKIENWKLKINLYGWAENSEKISELINRSKILVMPSYNEGGPRVVVEAMACGVPVLATPVGIVPDLLENGLGGEIIAWEVNDIVSKAKALLGDPERYQKYSKNGPEVARQFERKSAIKNYAESIKRLVN